MQIYIRQQSIKLNLLDLIHKYIQLIVEFVRLG